ncbi:MAG TPA: LPS assembly protein LptD [Steroidobacteraceae bacterium]|nr:LPS assembly protein LptD [Steroidobacteraceae bacterium]
MVRPGTFVLAVVALGSIISAARADEPPCPSQTAPPAAPAPSTAAAAAQGGKPAAAARGSGNIEVQADTADVSVEGKGSLKGDVVVRQGDVELRAGEMQIDKPNQFVKSTGSIEYRDPLVHVTGAGGSYSAATGAEFQGAHFDLRERGARGAADSLALTPDGVLHLRKVTFTTCPAAHEAWALKASSITLDTRDQIGTGRNASVDFLGVPLIYLPWVSFPLSSERKSGFLFPSIGSTSNNGFQLAVPYYWNIAPNADFTFQPVEYTKRGADLGGDLRFLTSDQRGELQWDYLPNDTLYGGSRNRVQLDDVVQLPAAVRLTVDAQAVSDVFYFQDFAQTPAGTSTSFLNRSATLSYRDAHWSVDAEAQQYQTIDTTVLVDERPYARVPRLAVDSDYTLFGVLHYGFESEIVDFQHAPGSAGLQQPGGVTFALPPLPAGWREDLTPGLSLALAGPGYFFRPALAWRATWYQLTDTLPGAPTSLSRNLPLARVDTGLAFERQSGSHDQRTLTLEPRMQYLYVPYRDQSALPVFDTGLPDLNAVELFRTNRYVGADRVSDANQLTTGLTSRLLDTQSGRQFLAATIGQSYYFTTPRVTLPGETPFTAPHSDFVAQLAITAFADWNADAGVQWDPDNQRSERTQLNLQYKPAPDAVVNLSYRYERFVQLPEFVRGVQLPCNPAVPIEPGIATGCDSQGFDQLDASAAWPIHRSWSAFAREVFDLRNHEELEGFAGFEYRACCWRLRLGARRYVSTFTGARDTGIWLQLELAGLAGVGSATDTSLSEEIRGYTPADTSVQKIKAP